MNRLTRFSFLLCSAAVTLLASCVKDGLQECDTYVRFVYDYNIAGADMATPGIDLFHRQASRVDLFLFDGNGVFTDRLTYTATGATFPEDFRITLPRGLDQATQLVAWSGLYEEDYEVSPMTAGQSVMSDLAVSPKLAAGEIQRRNIKPLWNGSVTGIPKSVNYTKDVITISLTKNTNNINVVADIVDDGATPVIPDFTIEITSANKAYKYDNGVVSAADMVNYLPFAQDYSAEVGTMAEFKVLRLMGDRAAVLKITDNNSGNVLLEKDIIPYLYASRPNTYSSMGKQEYLDREDSYRVIVFFKEEGGLFMATEIHINDWYIKLQGSTIEPEH